MLSYMQSYQSERTVCQLLGSNFYNETGSFASRSSKVVLSLTSSKTKKTNSLEVAQ